MSNCPICHCPLDLHTDSDCIVALQAQLDQLRALVMAVLQQPHWREFVSHDGKIIEIAIKLSGNQARKLLQLSSPDLVHFQSHDGPRTPAECVNSAPSESATVLSSLPLRFS